MTNQQPIRRSLQIHHRIWLSIFAMMINIFMNFFSKESDNHGSPRQICTHPSSYSLMTPTAWGLVVVAIVTDRVVPVNGGVCKSLRTPHENHDSLAYQVTDVHDVRPTA